MPERSLLDDVDEPTIDELFAEAEHEPDATELAHADDMPDELAVPARRRRQHEHTTPVYKPKLGPGLDYYLDRAAAALGARLTRHPDGRLTITRGDIVMHATDRADAAALLVTLPEPRTHASP